jgi:hypothetical protein
MKTHPTNMKEINDDRHWFREPRETRNYGLGSLVLSGGGTKMWPMMRTEMTPEAYA